MVLDFMVRQVLLLSSVLFCSACNKQAELQYFNANSLLLENKNGIIYHEKKPFSGIVFQLNENADTVAIFGFYKGKEHGEWKRFYPNRQVEEIRYFDKGVKINTLTRWWENGQMQLQCNFKNGEYDGTFKEWNREGRLTKEMNYKNGYEEGSQKVFYDNGKIRSNYVVKNQKRIGLLGTKNCINVSDSIFKK